MLGKLYGSLAKKIEDSAPTARAAKNAALTGSMNPLPIKISQVIKDVKNIYDDTFSKDVYAHFGMTQQNNDDDEHPGLLSHQMKSISDRTEETEFDEYPDEKLGR